MIEYPKKILLATDGTKGSATAASAAVALATSSGAELHMFHVGHAAQTSEVATAMRPALSDEPPGYAERQARKLLERQVEEIRAAGGTVSVARLRTGQPSSEVLALATELGVDLLVVGSGGPHKMRRAVAATVRRAALGRAADVIVCNAHCPVLVARGDGLPEADGS